ncbi:MAG: dihydroneopterin aldolase [Saprospiraceae bacterium]|nr:dihydroneopterin aldolase [Saprospiraceae bacterium]
MGLITLEGMSFYAHHGYYTDERKRGNNYVVDVQISYDLEAAAVSDDLDDALNYEIVYQVCHEEMNKPCHLIESVARTIARRIKEHFHDTEHVRVKVKKLNPELGGPVDMATCVYIV